MLIFSDLSLPTHCVRIHAICSTGSHFSGERGQLTTLSPFALAVAPRPTRAAGPGTCGAGVVGGVPGVCGPAGLSIGGAEGRLRAAVRRGRNSVVGRSDGQPVDSSGHVMRGAPVGCYLGMV